MSTVEDDEQDLTRKQRREQARAERKALEEAEAAGAARRTRLIRLGAVAGVVVVVIVAIVLATGGSGSKTAVPKTGKETETVSKQVSAELNGIPQNGATLGNPNAPVTLRYYGDLQCPICRDFTLGALPSIIQNYVRTGKLKIEYLSLETATREPETFRTQQVAALAAGPQKKAWNYIELFYHEQGEEGTEYVNEGYLQKLAQQVPGLNLGTWTTARNDPKYANSITEDAQSANNNGFTGTPSFLIGKTGGSMQKLEYTSLSDPASFNAAIEKQLKS